MSDCDPIMLNSDVNNNNATFFAFDGKTLLNQSWAANPCGLVAKSFFTDSFAIFGKDNITNVAVNEQGIAWASDIEYKFANYPGSSPLTW